MSFERYDGRKFDELRPCKITRNYLKHPEGSVLIEVGNTKVIITASVEDSIPRWMRDSNNSWITAEYGMLPRSTDKRIHRPVNRGNPGRTVEIQRLIGRALRGAFELEGIGEILIRVDADVIQADGGTRCASITGGFVAVYDAFKYAVANKLLPHFPKHRVIAAISVGIIDGQPLLDLPYREDSTADVDTNFVLDENLNIIEIQGTSEHKVFNKEELIMMLDLAEKGVKELTAYQKEILNI